MQMSPGKCNRFVDCPICHHLPTARLFHAHRSPAPAGFSELRWPRIGRLLFYRPVEWCIFADRNWACQCPAKNLLHTDVLIFTPVTESCLFCIVGNKPLNFSTSDGRYIVDSSFIGRSMTLYFLPIYLPFDRSNN